MKRLSDHFVARILKVLELNSSLSFMAEIFHHNDHCVSSGSHQLGSAAALVPLRNNRLTCGLPDN